MNNAEMIEMLNWMRKECVDSSGVPEDFVDGAPVVSLDKISSLITTAICKLASAMNVPPIKKFLFIEDGTVDTDALEEILLDRNPEIQMVIYRQGGRAPELKDV